MLEAISNTASSILHSLPSVSTPASSATAKKSKAVTPKKTIITRSHPKFSVMIKHALEQMNDRIGTSKAAILKYILSNFKVNSLTANQHLKSALRAGTKNQSLKQIKGVGASGSFKLAAAPGKTKSLSTGQKTKKAAKKPSSAKPRSRSTTPGSSKKPVTAQKKKVARSPSKAKSTNNKRKRSASPAKKAAPASSNVPTATAPASNPTPAPAPAANKKKAVVKKAKPSM